MSKFSNAERCDMLSVFNECGKSARTAERLYKERFPNRICPSRETFRYLQKSLLLRGKFPDGKHPSRSRPVTNEDNAILVLSYFEANPHASIRQVAKQLNMSVKSINIITKRYKYHPFKMTLVQELRVTDGQRRLEFLAWLAAANEEDPEIFTKIMWTDESKFTNNGVFNRRNQRYWSTENPHWTRDRNFQTKISVNVWCGILNGHLIGPYFFEENLTAARYLNFLEEKLPHLLQDISLNIRNDMYLQQDGCPAHNAIIIRGYLNNKFRNRWIGTYGPIRWPPRSPDLSPLDFYLWGYLQSVVYDTAINNVQELRNRITTACNNINRDALIMATTKNLIQRAEFCIIEGGSRFEHLM